MSRAARPKREAEEFARSHEKTSKKPRFDSRNPSTLAADAPEEDIILDADVIGKSGTNTKRNAVNIDGYESDSDNDNFDARARAKAKQKDRAAKSKDEDDDDMFADLEEDLQADGDEDEELAREGKGKGKDVRFLEQSEIEGQVMNSEAGGHVSAEILLGGKGKRAARDAEESESSGDEEERDQLPEEMDEEDAAELGAGSKKKHAPRLDAYNLKNEEEEGRFDESGNFVRKAQDPDAINDNWLEGVSKKDMKKAKEAEEKREEERRRKAMQDDAILTSDVLSNLISQLDTGETPLEALQRLGTGKACDKTKKKKKVPKWKQKKQQQQQNGDGDGMDVDETVEANGRDSAVDAKEAARRSAVDAITAAADALYSRGQHDIYQAEREILMRQYRRETGDDWKPGAVDDKNNESSGAAASSSTTTAAWEYRWSDARDGGSTHGPFDAATMHAWQAAGYFGAQVEFRNTASPAAEWSRVLDA